MKHLICPLCSEPFYSNIQGLSCINNHQYDRAKEGYFNLLPVQQKNSREPGDAKQQLLARRAFLQAGFFSPLRQVLLPLIPADAQSILDIGCGEGYFTQGISELFPRADIYGLDIAKVAIRMAARQTAEKKFNPNPTYIVASSYSLPVANSSMDAVVRIYAPSKDNELQRVLKPNGRLIIVTPGENHLLVLRKSIYQELRPHPLPKSPVGFLAVSQQQLSFKFEVPAGELSGALLEMTPFAWRLQPALAAQIIANGLQDTADFHLSVYQLA